MYQVKDRAKSTLAVGINDVVLSFTVATGEGSKFPATNFIVTMEDELLHVSSRSGDVCTVQERGFDGTTPAGHVITTPVALRIIAATIQELQSLVVALPVALG